MNGTGCLDRELEQYALREGKTREWEVGPSLAGLEVLSDNGTKPCEEQEEGGECGL